MDQTVFISLKKHELEALIIECVNSCLKSNREVVSESNLHSDQILTIDQAAEYLNLTKPTIYSLVSRGELPVMKRSKRLYFSKDELTNYLKQGRKKTNSEIESEALHLLNRKSGRV